MSDNYAEEARYVANALEHSDTLEGYRGARIIRTLAFEYEEKVHESENWRELFKDAEVRIDKLRSERGS